MRVIMRSTIFIKALESNPNYPSLETVRLVYSSFLPCTASELAAFDHYYVRRFQNAYFCTADKNRHQTCADSGVGCEK